MPFFSTFFLVLLLSLPVWSASDKERMMDAAQFSITKGKLEEAAAIYEQHLKNNPKDADTLVWLAGLYGLMDRPATQEALCRQALFTDPQHVAALINLGNAQCARHMWDEAEGLYLSAHHVAIQQSDTPEKRHNLQASLYALSQFYLARPQQDNTRAIAYADMCLALASDDIKKGVYLKTQTRAHNSEKILYKMAILNKAGALGNQKDFDAARAVLRDYLGAYPATPEALKMLETYPEHFPE